MDTVPERPAARPLQRRVAWVTIAWATSEPLLLDGTANRWAALLLGLLVTLPLLASRRAPVTAALLIVVAYLVQYAFGLRMEAAMSPELALALGLFGIAAYAPASASRSALALGLAAAVPLGLWLISLLDIGDITELATTQYLYLSAVAFAGVLPGIALRSRQREVQQLDDEVRGLYGRAADEIGAAVDGERRTLSHGIVRIVGELVDEIHALVDRNRRALLGDRTVNGAFDGQTAAAARRAADELRGLLKNLTGRTDTPAGAAAGIRATVRRPPPGTVRNALGLAVPVIAFAALGVLDRAELPPLPTSFPTTEGGTLSIPASAVPAAVGYLLAIATPLGLLLRRRLPVVAVASVAAMLVLRALLDELSSLTISQVFVCGALAYNAGAWPRTRAAALLALAIALGTTITCWVLEQYRFDPLVYGYMVAVLLGTWLVGRAIRHDLRDALALRQRATVLRAQRDRLCRAAVRGERREIAREMHDVVGHGLSLVAVQSGVVDVLAARDPARALEALALVEDAAETTRDELGALQTALASPSSAGDARSCSRSLERIVADARGSGQPVVADVDPAVDALDPDDRTAVVRIAQEALTNARKHAGDAAVSLEVEVGPDAVRLRVRNQAGAPREDLPQGSQLGLRGMAERAESRGGRLDAGPDAGGGWTVQAELPHESVDLVAT